MREKFLWGAFALCFAICMVLLFGMKRPQGDPGLAAILEPAPGAGLVANVQPIIVPMTFDATTGEPVIEPALGIGDRKQEETGRQRLTPDEKEKLRKEERVAKKAAARAAAQEEAVLSGVMPDSAAQTGITKDNRPTPEQMQEMSDSGTIIF